MGALPWRRLQAAGAVLLLGVLALNGLAYRHARRLTHFTAAGQQTPKPETLSFGEKLRALFAGPVLLKPRNRITPEAFGLPYERHLFPAADGLPLEAWLIRRSSSRGLVLLFHGYVDSKDSLLPQARAFHDLGFSALMVDFRGSGGSGGSETSLGFLESADVAGAFAYARRLGEPEIVLYGASMGAAAVLKAVAEERLAASALVMECPFDRLLSAVENRFEILGVPAFPAARLLVFWGGFQQGFDGFRHNPVDYALKVERPALLMQGDQDRRVALEEARAIFHHLSGPKAFKVFRGLGHESFLKARPQEWTAAVSGFLDRFRAPS